MIPVGSEISRELRFHRSTPFEYDQTAVSGHQQQLMPSAAIIIKPQVVSTPTTVPTSTLATASSGSELASEPSPNMEMDLMIRGA